MCPVSLIGQWIQEIQTKCPSLSVYCYHGGHRKKSWDFFSRYNVVVTSYGVLTSEKFMLRERAELSGRAYAVPMEQGEWWRVVLDESHTIKNGISASLACCALKSNRRWCVTGTPIVSSVHDLFHQYKFIGVNSLLNFYGNPSRAVWDRLSMLDTLYGNFSPQLMTLLRHSLIRHDKEQTTADGRRLLSLPPKTESVAEIRMTPNERSRYASMQHTASQTLRRMLSHPFQRNEASEAYRAVSPVFEFRTELGLQHNDSRGGGQQRAHQDRSYRAR